MKRIVLHTCIALMLCMMMQGKASAQVPVWPGANPDLFWYNSTGPFFTGYIAGLNTAMIDMYGNGINGTNTTLLVSDYYGNGTPGGVVFRDESSGFTIHQPYNNLPFPITNFYMAGSPDITIGNDLANPGTVFHVAVAYICLNMITFTTAPQIDYYTVTYTGFGMFTEVYAGSTFFTNVIEPMTIHIDVIAQSGNMLPTGYPFADHFIVTWDDLGYPAGRVFAFQSTVNAPVPVINELTAPVMSAQGMQPDVAGIERNTPPSCAACPIGVRDFGLITYTNTGGNLLFYCEWDVAAFPFPSLTYGLDATFPSPFFLPFQYPRIDAKDDYFTNAPTPLLPAFYKVAVQRNTAAGSAIWTYDHFACISGLGLAGWPPALAAPGFNEFAPTVAYGPNLTQYEIAYNSDDNVTYLPTYTTWNTFSAPIDETNSYSVVLPANNFYMVNNSWFLPTWFVNGNYLVATSTPCNNPTSHTLVAWSYLDNAFLPNPCSQVYFKTTLYPYAFKPGRNTHELSVSAPTEWKTYPNPATTVLNVDNPLAHEARYEVTDMGGKSVLAGPMPAGAQTLDLRYLSTGTYNIRTFDGDKQCFTSKFVKQ